MTPCRATTIATRARQPDAASARRARGRVTPASSATSLTARARSFAERACTSTIRLP
ncbi:MAG: hypothetical protein HYS77_03900 [Candidatus Rokubacteria bacterium]|nr:hypothetical protein [Candidatus Rokubacteria bacterium]